MDTVLGYSEPLASLLEALTQSAGMFYGITRTLGGGQTRSMTYLRDFVDASTQYKVRGNCLGANAYTS